MKAIIASLCLILSFSLFAQDSMDDAIFYTGSYKLVSKSRATKDLGLDKVKVTSLLSPHSSLLISFAQELLLETAGVTVQYSKKNTRFEFNTGLFDNCQDYDCYGVAALQGYFKDGAKPKSEKLIITFSFFEDLGNNNFKEWNETLEFIKD